MHKKLFLIILLAGLTRLFMLDKVPPSLNWDEISMGYTSYSILETGRDEWGEKLPIFFRSYGEWKSAVYIYVLVPFIKVIGLNAWAVRLPSALAGVLSVYLTYLITRKIFNERSALWASLLLAISPWHIMLSRPAFEANFSLTLILLGIYNLLRYTDQRSTRFLVYSAAFFGLAPHTYNSAKIITPFLIIWLLYRLKSKIAPKHLLLYLAILILFAVPILSNIVGGRAQHRYGQVGVTTDQKLLTEFYGYRATYPAPQLINKALFNKYTFFVLKFTDNYLSYFSPNFLLTEGGDHNQHSIKYFGLLYFSEFILVIYGLLNLSKSSKSRVKYLPVMMIILGFIPPATTRDTHHVLRSILTLPGWQILAGVGMTSLISKQRLLEKFLKLLLTIQATFFIFTYFYWYPIEFARDWQYGYQEAAQFVNEHESEYSNIVFTKWFGEPQLFLAFYNRWDPTEYQQLNKSLIRYEDEGKLWIDQMEEYSIGKYQFKYINWQEETRSKDTLYIGKFDDFYTDSDYLKTITYPNGWPAFHIVRGDKDL